MRLYFLVIVFITSSIAFNCALSAKVRALREASSTEQYTGHAVKPVEKKTQKRHRHWYESDDDDTNRRRRYRLKHFLLFG
ncbi:hypothetical protein Plhal304r1_c007g0028251 [Plasmopara halstedii]